MLRQGSRPGDTRRLHWRSISSTDYTNFLTFLGIIKGAKYNFTFTDYDGSIHTARITNGESIESSPVMTGKESLTVELMFE